MRTFAVVALISSVAAPAWAQIGASPAGAASPEPTPATETTPATQTSSEDYGESTAPAAAAAANALVLDARPSSSMATGLFRTAQASGLRPGTFGMALHTEFFTGTDVVRGGDDASRFIGHLGLSWTPLAFLETWASLSARATTNSLGDPELIQSVGDLGLGAKGFGEVSPGVHVGGLFGLRFPAGANDVSLDFAALSVDLAALLTLDLRALADAPVRFHLNLGYVIDRSEELFDFRLERIERFGHNVFDYNRARSAIAVDAPLQYVTPSIEWVVEYPTGAACDASVPQPCVTDGDFSAYPSWLVLGLASAPFQNGLAMHAGVEIGVTTAESQGTPAVPAWNMLLGLSYHLQPGGTRIVEVPAPVAAAPVAAATSWVVGRVTDAATGAPIAGARVRYLEMDLSQQLTSEDGSFRSYEFAPGTEVTIEVIHPEYVTRAMRVAIMDAPIEGPIEMQQSFTGTRLSGNMRAASAGTPVQLSLRGAQSYDLEVTSGAYQLDVAAGEYVVTATAPGHLSSRQRMVLNAGRRDLSIDLRATPPGLAFRVSADEIVLDDPNIQVTFTGTRLTPEGEALLQQVADLMSADSTLRVRVIAHTDDNENPSAEQVLTTDRAMAAVDYLVSRGIPQNRLIAEGVGATVALFPNISDRNRRRNNRLQFVIEP